jgi:acyl-CoA synthetase (AMP-forming)/AMP-acid ligase II
MPPILNLRRPRSGKPDDRGLRGRVFVLAKILADGVARHPDDPAVIVGDQTHTYADLFRLSHALARSLSDRGIEAGDRIAFLLPNGLEIVLCYYACFILGAIAVPLNIRFPPERIAYVLDHSEARVLISEPGLFAGIVPIRSERRSLETVYLAGARPVTGVEDFGDLLRAVVAPEIDWRSDPGRPAALFYTSGTTGTPKGVIHTHGSLMGAVENQIAEIGITRKDKTLIVLPICYLVAFGSQVLPFHAAGAASVVLPGFEPQKSLAAIHTHQPTKLFGFPKVYHELAEAAHASAYDVGCLDFCFSAGEAMAVALQQHFKATFGIEITEGCGMTELHVYSMNPPYGVKKVGSIGRPIAGMEVRLVDEQGRPVEGSDAIGEVVVRGTSMSVGYWKNAELTREQIKDGWFYTGDLAQRDDDGDYWFFSRKSEVIRQGGHLVSPLELEAALYQHSSVKEVGVAGVPDGAGGQWAVAHVVLKGNGPPVDERMLIDFAAAKLPSGKAPRRVVFTNRLPYGLTGKIDRRALTGS